MYFIFNAPGNSETKHRDLNFTSSLAYQGAAWLQRHHIYIIPAVISEAVNVFAGISASSKCPENPGGSDPPDLWRVRGHTLCNYLSVMSSALEPEIARLGLFRAIGFPCENTRAMTSLHHLA